MKRRRVGEGGDMTGKSLTGRGFFLGKRRHFGGGGYISVAYISVVSLV
jgi:hypothetical protein